MSSLPVLCASLVIAITTCACTQSAKRQPTTSSSKASTSEQATVNPSKNAEPKLASKMTYKSMPHPGVSTLDCDKVVRGKTLKALQLIYGPPASTTVIDLDKGVPEFRVELLNDYPPNKPTSKGVKIFEHRYDYYTYHGTIWYHKVAHEWVALQAVTWSKSIEF